MTASVVSSAATVGQAPAPVRDRAYWANVLHNAAQVPVAHPQYDNARAVIQMSLDAMQNAADSASARDTKDISPGKLATAAVLFGHGASLGLAGDPTYIKLARQANPKTAFVSDVAGTAALGGALSPLVAGLTPAKATAVIGGTLAAGRGAIEPPFPQLNRAENAAIMGVGGALTGALIGKFVGAASPVVRTIIGNAKRLLGFGVPPSDLAAITESAIRAQLGKMRVAPELIERAVQSWKTTGELTVRGMAPPTVETPVTVRPGETITQTSPRGFTGVRETPPVPTTPTIAEMQGITTRTPDVGTGKTLPYYPRGGQVEQSFGPAPVQSAVPTAQLAPNQNQAFVDFLKGAASPAEATARVGTLKALGVLQPGQDAQILQLLGISP